MGYENIFQKQSKFSQEKHAILQIRKSLTYIGNFKPFFQNRFIMDNGRVKIYLMFA
ncbi:hypothetical protein B4099_1361 [Heyndrickxia coagulans]|uniref:Uncharacterized protein n=1 Tax=Heyndrickxia coagulans TaxID=1398 RepID=A0A150KGH9_HEYCO|nr:hypothetical protein B4099_1361 [Heyndrickxia coagulans]